jgi:Ca2+-binding EF-hand superfamily protein
MIPPHNLILLTLISSLLLHDTCEAAELTTGPISKCLAAPKVVEARTQVFSVHDTDQDGVLSRDEYEHFIGQLEIRRKAGRHPMRGYLPSLNFHEIDRNTDGFITEDEMLSTLSGRLKKHRRYRYRGSQP